MYYYIYDFYTKICNRERLSTDNCLFMHSDPGIGKSNSWEWIAHFIDTFYFNPSTNGCGKYDGAVSRLVGIAKDVQIHQDSICDAYFSTLLGLMEGRQTSIKVHGAKSTNCSKCFLMFVSNGMPNVLPRSFTRRMMLKVIGIFQKANLDI